MPLSVKGDKKTVYLIKSPWGPAYRVYNKDLAEELLLKACAKFNQRFELEIQENKE